jgi:murein DD-endopeptidase MepM/ murein hydrolase activator NlpD
VQPYGWRYSEQRQRWRMHVGHDLIAPAATPVLAMLSGRVHLAQTISGYGLTVLIEHGRVGRSGSASTDHLHVELRRLQGRQAYALDLAPLLPH